MRNDGIGGTTWAETCEERERGGRKGSLELDVATKNTLHL